ncbi:hypothetical protein [Candidatus Ichthyocystis hellenicum]|uniref:hypothetical protein n=1 Tax=Candidatus Ichthyocystis hellenicum TaxID=1561003 RepID=UPI000B811103|nr:hypothetical protein [Candidatus Ichthyocystis hellenicum]
MDYINANKYLNCLECDDLESQTEGEVIEDNECKELVLLEQKTNRCSPSIGRSLRNKVVVASSLLGFIGVLESAAGSRITSLPSNHCNLSSLVCAMVTSGYSELINETLGMAFNNFLTNPNHRNQKSLSRRLIKPYINDSIPVTVVIDESSNLGAISRQLSVMAEYIKDLYSVLNPGDSDRKGNNADLIFCNNNVENFCYKNHSRDYSYYGRCCANISSYIEDITYALSTTSVPTADSITYNMTTSSVTEESTAIISTNTTTSPVLTTLSSVLTSLSPVDVTTEVTTASNENNGSLSTFIFVIVLFFVGVVLLFAAYMGIRSGRRRGVYHVGGSGEESRPVYMRDNIEEHLEEDEEESRTVSRPVYVGEDIEEHSI